MQLIKKNAVTLRLDGIQKRYPSSPKLVLDEVSLSFASGRISAIVGPNGAGKTTLAKIIAGLITPDRGTVTWADERNVVPAPRTMLVLEGGRGFYPKLSVIENFSYLLSVRNGVPINVSKEIGGHWLSRFNLSNVEKAPVQSLSRGMTQRLALALALASESRAIILDEPTNGLDISESRNLFEILRQAASDSDVMVIFNSHQPDTILGLANDVQFIKDGKTFFSMDEEDLKLHSQNQFVDKYMSLMAEESTQ
jgi:ABC-type multidrug transport system ATPase subunit